MHRESGPRFTQAAAACTAACQEPTFGPAIWVFGGNQVYRRVTFSVLAKHILRGSRVGQQRWSWLGHAYCSDVVDMAQEVSRQAEGWRLAKSAASRAAPWMTEDRLEPPMRLLVDRLMSEHLKGEERAHLAARIERRLDELVRQEGERTGQIAERNRLKEECAVLEGKRRVTASVSSLGLATQIRDLRERVLQTAWYASLDKSVNKGGAVRGRLVVDLSGLWAAGSWPWFSSPGSGPEEPQRGSW